MKSKIIIWLLFLVPCAQAAPPVTRPFSDFPAKNKIDELNLAKLKEVGLQPSDLCTDQEFLRRVYLDVIGLLPTSAEARTFLANSDPNKRARLIDQLLQRKEFADFWALKWGDLLRIKSEQDSNIWPNAVQVYYRWLRQSIATDQPYDQFARQLLVSTGSNFRNGPVNFYRAMRDRNPDNHAKAAALVFMGVRLGCAQCHPHPTEKWGQEDSKGMAAFFTQVKIKSTQEWKEEIVYLDPQASVKQAKPLGAEPVEIPEGADARARFADWLTAPENPWFARNLVNRVWFWLMGRGIIHEPDDMRPSNLPSNPALLAYLEKEFVGSKYQVKHVFRLILNSKTYQLSSQPKEGNGKDNPHFARYRPRRLGAEQLADAIGQVTGVYETYLSVVPEPWTWLPEGYRATQLADGSISTPFLNMFGRPARNTGYESERDLTMSSQQALYLLDSADIKRKVQVSPVLDDLLVKFGKDKDNDLINEIYLSALSRPANAREIEAILTYRGPASNRRQAMSDVMWAIINTKEFLANR